MIAAFLAGSTGVVIQSIIGRQEAILAQGLIFAISFLVGFGLVYGPSFIRAYTSSSDNRQQST
ncbi:hypothetical protein BN903_44 [Halorubrum sp. AJ67]|nr:hypothetical protein BN903_44 [Halorubrum sp. AJ67]